MTATIYRIWLGPALLLAAFVAIGGARGSDWRTAKMERPVTASGTLGSQARVARPIPRGSYRGRTSQGWTVNLKVSSDGRRIITFASSVTLICRISGTY